MKAKAIREMDNAELLAQVERLEEELYRDRVRHVTKELDNTAQLNLKRKDLARVKTVLRERNIVI